MKRIVADGRQPLWQQLIADLQRHVHDAAVCGAQTLSSVRQGVTTKLWEVSDLPALLEATESKEAASLRTGWI